MRRFDGDELVFDFLDAWKAQNEHLWTWESCQRIKSWRRRREFYRITACRLAETYQTLVLEGNFDLRDTQRLPENGGVQTNPHARSQQTVAAISEFRTILVRAFESRRGGRVVFVEAAHTTNDCHACGHRNAVEEQLEFTCQGCYATWDQDDNAARNLLARTEMNQRGEAASVACSSAETNPAELAQQKLGDTVITQTSAAEPRNQRTAETSAAEPRDAVRESNQLGDRSRESADRSGQSNVQVESRWQRAKRLQRERKARTETSA